MKEDKLVLSFASFREKEQVNQIQFNSQIYDVKDGTTLTIELSQEFFEDNETKSSDLKLLKDSVLISEAIIEICKGYNHSYCFLDEEGYTFSLLFNKDTPTIKLPISKENSYEINQFDTNGTKYRKRYTFINFSHYSLMINNTYFTIPKYFSKIKSYRLSVYNIEDKVAIAKSLYIEKNESFNLCYDKYYSESCLFSNKINNITKSKKFKDIGNFLNTYSFLDRLNFFLNMNKKKLDNMLKTEEHIKFFSNISIYKVVKNIKNFKSFKEIVECHAEKVKEIKENKSLKVYQKILLINFFSDLCAKCKSKEEIQKLNFSYYLMEEKQKDSVLDLVYNFFKKYRDIINEDSPVFEKLIELDGGAGIYKNELYYCYSMQNLNEIKKHLGEIETSIFVTHNLENNNMGYTNIASGLVSVNIHYIKQYKNLGIGLNQTLTEDKKEIGKNIASKIVYIHLHEINGHKKYTYKNKKITSPAKFIEKGTIYTLCKTDSDLKIKNAIKILPSSSEGEDGYFYELVYGKIGDYYTFQILDNLDDFSDLLTEVNLWVNDIGKLKEYIKYKYAIQFYKSNYKSLKSDINEKINDYKNNCQILEKKTNICIDSIFRIKKEKNKEKIKRDNIRIKKFKNIISKIKGINEKQLLQKKKVQGKKKL